MSQGVYSGYDIGVSALSGSTVSLSAGALHTGVGVVVVETEAVNIDLGSSFPPAAATNYTIYAYYAETAVGLTGGDAATYLVTDSLLTDHPTDGTLIGWIRHPGGGVPLDAIHITNAPKLASAELAATYAARQPVYSSPPNMVLAGATFAVLGADMASSEGYDEPNRVAWRGVTNGGGVIEAGVLFAPFRVFAQPYQLRMRSIVPGSCTLDCRVYDTLHVLNSSTVISGNTTWTWDTIAVSEGIWTSGSQAMFEIRLAMGAVQTVKIAELEVDFWPFGTSRT